MSRVTLSDQSTYDAEVVGFDQDKDVAVLHIDGPKNKLRPIPIGISADLLVGQKVYAIGNPVSAGSPFSFPTCAFLLQASSCIVLFFNFLFLIKSIISCIPFSFLENSIIFFSVWSWLFSTDRNFLSKFLHLK